MPYKTYTAMVLKRQPLREADELVTFWSWEEGKIRLLVRAVRKNSSKLKSAISPLSWILLETAPSKHLPTVVGARMVKSYPGLSRDLGRVASVFSIFDMVMAATPDHEPNPAISMLLRQSLDHLEREPASLEFLVSFRLRMLAAMGYSLSFERCSSCQALTGAVGEALGRGAAVTEKAVYWSFFSMGVVCAGCAAYSADAAVLDDELLNFLIASAGNSVFAPLKRDKVLLVRAEKLLQNVFFSLTEREMRSRKFLEENVA